MLTEQLIEHLYLIVIDRLARQSRALSRFVCLLDLVYDIFFRTDKHANPCSRKTENAQQEKTRDIISSERPVFRYSIPQITFQLPVVDHSYLCCTTDSS